MRVRVCACACVCVKCPHKDSKPEVFDIVESGLHEGKNKIK